MLTTGLRVGDRVETYFDGRGTVIAAIGVGVTIKFDNGKTEKVQHGILKKLLEEDKRWNK